MTAQELADQILRDVARLNDKIQNSMDSISVNQAKHLESTIREAEGWLMGCRQMIE